MATAHPSPADAALVARLAGWTEEKLCDYLFYLVCICGVAVHQRYAVALLSRIGGGGGVAAAAAENAVRQRLFPAVRARAAALQPTALRLLRAVAARSRKSVYGTGDPSVVVGLALVGGGGDAADGAVERRVGEAADTAVVLALGRRTAHGGVDGAWASTAFASALAEAVTLEQRLGIAGGPRRRLVPAVEGEAMRKRPRQPTAVVSVVVDDEEGDVEGSRTATTQQPPTRRLEEYFQNLKQSPAARQKHLQSAPSHAAKDVPVVNDAMDSDGDGVVIISDVDSE